MECRRTNALSPWNRDTVPQYGHVTITSPGANVRGPPPRACHAGVEPVALPNDTGAHAPGRRTDAADLGERGLLPERVRLRSHGLILGTRRDAGAPPTAEPG